MGAPGNRDAPPMSLRFSSTVRLKARPEFLAVQEHGYRVATKFVTVLGIANSRPCDRLGLIASRKFGNAVARNRAKRRLREIFRRQEPDTAGERGLKGLDLVAIPGARSSRHPLPWWTPTFRKPFARSGVTRDSSLMAVAHRSGTGTRLSITALAVHRRRLSVRALLLGVCHQGH